MGFQRNQQDKVRNTRKRTKIRREGETEWRPTDARIYDAMREGIETGKIIPIHRIADRKE